MEAEVVSRLIDLNHQFYQTFAAEFAATRQRLQPGVASLLPRLGGFSSILDIGCGSGELARRLGVSGYTGQYVGLDFSENILAHASRAVAGVQSPGSFQFHQADLANPDWDWVLNGWQAEAVLAFAVLHHLPGADLQLQTVKAIHRCLKAGGLFYFSVWQFRSSPRLAARVLPWEEIGLSASQVEAGDALLDWRAGGRGLRYVHEFNSEELASLAQAAGFRVEETFYADGKQGRLALYQVWRKEVKSSGG